MDCESVKLKAENVKTEIHIKSLKRHVCPYLGCHSAFNRPWKLERHKYTHTKERPFSCDYQGCQKSYTNKSHLNRHKSISHAETKSEPVFVPCPYPDCRKVFMNKWSLKRHSEIHKKKNYECPKCGVSFKKNRQLKDHLVIHLDVQSFVCDTCKESFNTYKNLKIHKKKHKIYNCEYNECQEQFYTWNGLRKHVKMAHPTLYKCDTCDKTYKNKWTLTEHVLSHLPIDKRDAFTCPYDNCKRFYFHARNLKHHIKSFHRSIKYKCEVENCENAFVKKTALTHHQRLIHTESGNSKTKILKTNRPRKPRCDKGQPKKSMVALLSGLILPYNVDRDLAQNKITPEVVECIENVKNILEGENICQEEQSTVKKVIESQESGLVYFNL